MPNVSVGRIHYIAEMPAKGIITHGRLRPTRGRLQPIRPNDDSVLRPMQMPGCAEPVSFLPFPFTLSFCLSFPSPYSVGSMSPTSSISTLLHAIQAGDESAATQLFAQIYDELHRLARCVRGRGTPSTLNTTALVHEAYLHLRPDEGLNVESKRHFLRMAARAMRQVLAREARRRNALKRGGNAVTVSFRDSAVGRALPLSNILTLEDALDALDCLSPRRARVVECRYFGGLTIAETAEALDVSPATVKRDWRTAKAWLYRALGTDS